MKSDVNGGPTSARTTITFKIITNITVAHITPYGIITVMSTAISVFSTFVDVCIGED